MIGLLYARSILVICISSKINYNLFFTVAKLDMIFRVEKNLVYVNADGYINFSLYS